MTESEFIKANSDSWKRLEYLLTINGADPDEIQSLFVKISSDLSYARTFYPRRAVRLYLNDLVNQVFDSMRTRKKYRFLESIKRFYTQTLPAIILEQWPAFLVSLLTFLAAVCVGIFSSFEDADFLREIVGDRYVNMTESNIQNNDPMAVYKDSDQAGMFLGITVNNIKVAFFTFVLGIFSAAGSIYILISNGIMLGAFQTFFYQKGLFLSSFLTIWIHGTIEISSIIVAGAAGIILGNGLLFKGSFTRSVSIRNAAVKSLIVLLSTVPLFIVAGFLEGFVTRHTDLPALVKWLIIVLSLAFILLIYVINPFLYKRTHGLSRVQYIQKENEKSNTVDISAPIERSAVSFTNHFGDFVGKIILPSTILFAIGLYFFIELNIEDFNYEVVTSLFDLQHLFTLWPLIITSLLCALFILKFIHLYFDQNGKLKHLFSSLANYPLPILLLIVTNLAALLYLSFWFCLAFIFVFPYAAFMKAFKSIGNKEKYTSKDLLADIGLYYQHWVSFLIPNLIITTLALLIFSLIHTGIGQLLISLISFYTFFEIHHVQLIYVSHIIAFPFFLTLAIYGSFLLHNYFINTIMVNEASDLFEGIEQFGVES